MIAYILREERVGGYWMSRREGRATELDARQYAALCHVHDSRWDDGARARTVEAARRDPMVADLVSRAALDTTEGWAAVRHVPAEVPPELLPADAAAAPKRIYFEITRRCNLRCHSCFNGSGLPMHDELSMAEIFDVNRQAYELGVFEIRYTGGECTTVPEFPAIVADARAKGIYVSIGTNGVYSDEQLDALPDWGVDWFIISLDGARESNDAVRGKGTYDAVMRTLARLAAIENRRVRLNMVVARHNVAAVEAVAAVCERHRVDSLNLIPLRPYGRSLARLRNDMFQQSDFYDFIREVNRLRKAFPKVTFSTTIDLLDPEEKTSHDLIVQKKTTCAAGVEACVVGPKGHVYGCSYSPASFPGSMDREGHEIFVAGNLRDDELRTIWRDSSRWAVFRDLSRYKNSKCHSCGHYQVRCSGSCQIMSWHRLKHESNEVAGPEGIAEFFDPYCFVDLLEEEESTADLGAPCGGAGMDGF